MRRSTVIVIVFLCSLLGGRLALADTPARLLRWNGQGEVAANRGPGPRMFRLEAVVSWSASAPRDPYRYAVRVTMPDGETITRAIEVADAPPSRSLTVLVPAEPLRDLRPEQVKLAVEIVDTVTGTVVSDTLNATIDNFRNPGVGESDDEKGPFGWGTPMEIPSPGAARLPRPAPSGMGFVRVRPEGQPGFTIAVAEASVADVKRVLADYDPRSGRSDDFRLEEPSQPAVALTPSRANAFLEGLGAGSASSLSYRLPTEEEWQAAARAGKSTTFWWGEEATFPDGANLLGPEPALAIDTTASVIPGSNQDAFRPNPWGLFHTFGNVAEWATRADGSFVRLGGHFRTEPANPLPSENLEDSGSLGADPYVGVRPVLELDADTGAKIVRGVLDEEKALSGVEVAFDPDSSTVVLTGKVEKMADRKLADRKLSGLWFVTAVENKIEGPGVPEGRLATIESRILARKRKIPLGRVVDEVTVPVRWASRLPVQGSHWFVNVFSREGAVFSYPLITGDPDPRQPLVVAIDRNTLGVNPEGVIVALSLGSPAATTTSPNVVSNLAVIK